MQQDSNIYTVNMQPGNLAQDDSLEHGSSPDFQCTVYDIIHIIHNIFQCYLLLFAESTFSLITYSLYVCGSICRDLACACIFFLLSLFSCVTDICGYKPG